MGWKRIEIPAKLVGEEVTHKSGRYEHSRTQIFLPEKSDYPGYMFWHPTKLISRSSDGRSAFLSYSIPGFIFKLEKREREPGRRYKRFQLNVPEFEAIYLPLEEAIHLKRKQKQDAQAAQIGNIVLYRRVSYNNADIWFDFIPKSNKAKSRAIATAVDMVVLAEGVTRSVFTSSLDLLEEMRKPLAMSADVIVLLEFGRYKSVTLRAKDNLLHAAKQEWDDCINKIKQSIEERKESFS